MDSKSYQERRASLGLFGTPNQADPEPTHAEIAEWLAAKGFTKHVSAESDEYSLDLMIRPTADLDGSFKAYDLDEDEWLTVYGWQFVVEEYPT